MQTTPFAADASPAALSVKSLLAPGLETDGSGVTVNVAQHWGDVVPSAFRLNLVSSIEPSGFVNVVSAAPPAAIRCAQVWALALTVTLCGEVGSLKYPAGTVVSSMLYVVKSTPSRQT